MPNQKIFFAVLASRLGLQFAPIGSQKLNVGVESGGSVILKYLQENHPLESAKVFTQKFEDPESFYKICQIGDTLKLYDQVATNLLEAWQNDSQLVSLGGDHSVSYVSLQAVLKKFGQQNVGIIMFDSHADLHLIETSPTGNFHGMWLRTFFADFSTATVPKILPSQLSYVGNLLTEAEEDRFIHQEKISVWDAKKSSDDNAQKLLQWAKKFKHLHISFDLDIFSQKLAPATGTPNPNGFDLNQVATMLKPLKEHRSWSLDLVELNPRKCDYQSSLNLINAVFELLF